MPSVYVWYHLHCELCKFQWYVLIYIYSFNINIVSFYNLWGEQRWNEVRYGIKMKPWKKALQKHRNYTAAASERICTIPGGPEITEQSIQSIFQDFTSNQQLFSSPCWIEHLFPIIITPRSSNLVENFLFYETFLMDCHFRDLPDFQSLEARWHINGKSPKWQSIRNYSSNKKFSTKFDDLGVIIMRKRCSIQQGKKMFIRAKS